ncbi:monodechloroaminopyrrolnitrin synthase PrnB family protein [Actinopolyspora mortivallis]|uniref:monodechloroaminopyrrolnitrin synthase PrnB family protein n=1 Tax=Actinopolyspora mortivallis TaxID=33906 RepID=UPI0003628F20|nr:monodechloroaminopyrrolnitrin synthase PrnB family protein [Actinopolyspora mortivallis]
MNASPTAEYGSPEQLEATRSADPLGADEVCSRLPEMNAEADLAALADALRDLLPGFDRVAELSTDECLAAVRDLGMLLGSIKRHGSEPAVLVPEVLPVLMELGRRTDMVPRDTVLHYCVWNPEGTRRRMYTGDPQERTLQNAVRHVFPHLHEGLRLCAELNRTSPEDERFAVLATRIDGNVRTMLESIDTVLAEVSPVFFARTLRPYFEEISLGGQNYLGPAAAQVPLWLVDEVVWLSDRGIAEYEKFLLDSVPYGLPLWRELHAGWRHSPSAVTRLMESFERAGGHDRAGARLRDSAAALAGVLRTAVTFRGRHYRIARQAYQEEVRLYPLGSGGGSVDLLHRVLLLTRQNSRIAEERAKRGS